MLSDSPPEKDINWSEAGINGSWKICQKIWILVHNNSELLAGKNENQEYIDEALQLIKKIHQGLDSITQSIEKFQMNVAIAKVFEMVNSLSKFQAESDMDQNALRESLKILIRVIEPMVPHLAEECWSLTKSEISVSNVPWPIVKKEYLIDDEVTVVIQINGKRRAEVNMPKDAKEKDVYNRLHDIKNIKDALDKKI